ncbi:MAG: hypothetical protein P9X24_11780 [Candidatus Hatepunaea meridiana]|nr:hypothetical protein [Candidatus Hatepunaea meridiana]
MRTYKALLDRSYSIKVNAENEDMAKELCEWFYGDITDDSTPEDRSKHRFSFGEIEMLINEATGVEVID